MPRSLAQVDRDLEKAENNIRDIRAELGKAPSNKPNVMTRLSDLEKLSPTVSQLRAEIDATDVTIKEMKKNYKEFRLMMIGLVVGLQLFKVDIQALKLDITLFKEWKKKDASNFLKSAAQFTKDLFDKQGKQTRLQLEAQEKQRKEDEEKEKKELEAKLKGIPGRVDHLEGSVKTASLRNELDRFYYQKSHAEGLHKGIHRAQESADKANREIESLVTRLRKAGTGASGAGGSGKNGKKNINDLRASVTALSQALAGI
ncbi:hypothetical protein [Streptomyces sp. NBC_00696]|uniref:hypothetical protein n=1 Tax=Streptomyces sp. NBC_00696 TaxID=2903672 RepID=UPI002E344C84|nr:hypothetical protein [Streptomyces sp. NBC_00696]